MSPEEDAVVHRRVALYALPDGHRDSQVWDDADGYHNDDDDDYDDYDDDDGDGDGDDDDDDGGDNDDDDDEDDDVMMMIRCQWYDELAVMVIRWLRRL